MQLDMNSKKTEAEWAKVVEVYYKQAAELLFRLSAGALLSQEFALQQQKAAT